MQILIQLVWSGAGESAFQQIAELPGKISDAQLKFESQIHNK